MKHIILIAIVLKVLFIRFLKYYFKRQNKNEKAALRLFLISVYVCI